VAKQSRRVAPGDGPQLVVGNLPPGVGHHLLRIVRSGAFTDETPGRVLRSGTDTDTVHAGADWAGAAR
jgi:hypothetical protein